MLSWLEWQARRERLIHDGNPTARRSRLEALIADIRAGRVVELDGQDLPAQLTTNREGRFRLDGDRLTQLLEGRIKNG